MPLVCSQRDSIRRNCTIDSKHVTPVCQVYHWDYLITSTFPVDSVSKPEPSIPRRSRWRMSLGCTAATLALTLSVCRSAAQPRPETRQAFVQYAAAVEARIERDRGTSRFLRLAGDRRRQAQLRGGEVVELAEKTRGVQPSIAIPAGQVQHWLGAGFIPGMTLARALPKLQDYNNRKRDMA